VTVDVTATQVGVSGELHEGLHDGSSVSAEGRVYAGGDEPNGGEIFVETLIESVAKLSLQKGSRGEASASAAGRATATGVLPGTGKVTAESSGSTSASVASDGNPQNPILSSGRGSIYGRSALEGVGTVHIGESAVRSEVSLDKDGEASATADGKAGITADSTFLKGKGAASGSSGAYGYQEWNGTLSSRSEVAGYLDVDTVSGVYSVDSISTAQSVSQSISNSVSNYYYGETEGYANGKAQAQASPKNGVAATSLDASANGYSWSGVLQGGMGSASATGQVSASSDVDPDGTGGSFGTLQFGPTGFDDEARFDYTGGVVDASTVHGGVILDDGNVDSFLSGGAYASGNAQTKTMYLLHKSSTSAKGQAWAGGDSLGDSILGIIGDLFSLNAISGQATDQDGGELSTHVFSVPRHGR